MKASENYEVTLNQNAFSKDKYGSPKHEIKDEAEINSPNFPTILSPKVYE